MCHPFLVLLNTSKADYYLVIEYRYVNISNNGCPYIEGVCEDSPVLFNGVVVLDGFFLYIDARHGIAIRGLRLAIITCDNNNIIEKFSD